MIICDERLFDDEDEIVEMHCGQCETKALLSIELCYGVSVYNWNVRNIWRS